MGQLRRHTKNRGHGAADNRTHANQEIYDAAMKFVDGAVEKKKPFFLWFNTTRMHVWTHLKKESEGKTGIGLYPDGMVEHDEMVGKVLKKIDDLGIANNTIVIYSTDNGAEKLTWPDGGSTPFFGEKGTTWDAHIARGCGRPGRGEKGGRGRQGGR